MTLDELEQYEAEMKVTCLIHPVKFTELDVLDLVNLTLEYDDVNWEPLNIPIIKKIVQWHICNEEYYTGFYRSIQDLQIASQTKYHANRKYRDVIDEYKKWKNNLSVEKQNDKLGNWFNKRTNSAGETR